MGLTVTQLHPVFHAVNLAILTGVHAAEIAGGFSLTVHLAALAMHVDIEAARRGVIVHETNRYLDCANAVLFKPRGLYAMIMTSSRTRATRSTTSTPGARTRRAATALSRASTGATTAPAAAWA